MKTTVLFLSFFLVSCISNDEAMITDVAPVPITQTEPVDQLALLREVTTLHKQWNQFTRGESTIRYSRNASRMAILYATYTREFVNDPEERARWIGSFEWAIGEVISESHDQTHLGFLSQDDEKYNVTTFVLTLDEPHFRPGITELYSFYVRHIEAHGLVCDHDDDTICYSFTVELEDAAKLADHLERFDEADEWRLRASEHICPLGPIPL